MRREFQQGFNRMTASQRQQQGTIDDRAGGNTEGEPRERREILDNEEPYCNDRDSH